MIRHGIDIYLSLDDCDRVNRALLRDADRYDKKSRSYKYAGKRNKHLRTALKSRSHANRVLISVIKELQVR
jgi:hypothetical protein